MHAAASTTPELRAALQELLLRRSRWMMLLTAGAVVVFIAVTHAIGSARPWTDLMNVGVGAMLVAGLLLARLPVVQQHIVALCVVLGVSFVGARAVAGIWQGDVATAIFMVAMGLVVAAALPWGFWPQLILVAALGGAVVANSDLVAGGVDIESGRAAANVALGLGISLILAAQNRRHHVRMLAERVRRRGAETALARLNADLERRIDERTAELKRAEQAALQHQADLAHVLRLGTIGEMTAGLAHEINQPLGAIANYAQGCARRLRAGTVSPDALLSIVDAIGAEALRGGEIIRRLRDLIRKDSGRQVDADLNRLVRESIRLIAPEVRARKVALHLELSPSLPAVSCNDIQIEQVMLNLLLNGVEATEVAANGRRLVPVRTALTGDGAEVTVTDSGVGLPAPPADVFAPFYTTKPTGLGMGLSISRSIIEAHGGRLWGSGNAGHGATFRFTLPCR
jgi:signal transduction histidine kinase